MSMLRRAALAAVLLFWAGSLAQPVLADYSNLNQGLGVFTSQTTGDKVGTLNAGDTALVYVRTDDFNQQFFSGMIAAQFAVEVDPRLEVVNTFPASGALVVSEVHPNEWIIGLNDCVEETESPFLLMAYEVRILPGVTDTSDLRIDVGDLVVYDQPMLYGPCDNPESFVQFFNAGGALLNPSSPAVVHVSADPTILVEGRPLKIAWESTGATSATLNGSAVAVTGNSVPAPISDTTYTLEVSDGSTTAQDQVDVQVIREPVVEFFTAELFETGGQTKVQLRWEVVGANTIFISGVPGGQVGIGGTLANLQSSASWTMTATNEWGTTTAVATLGDLGNEPPVVLLLAASPNPFLPGQSVELTWSIFNGDTASFDQGVGSVDPASGTTTVNPFESTTYTLTTANANGTTTRSVLVQLLPPGINAFRSTPTNIYPGESTTLSWDADPGQTLEITPDVGPLATNVGSVEVTPTADNTIYTLTGTSTEGTVSSSVQVNWLLPEVALAASNLTPFATESIDLVATAEGAETLTLTPGFGALDPAGEIVSTLVGTTTTFSLVGTNAKGSATAEVTVTPKAPLASLVASSNEVFLNEPFDLVATIQGATSATLEPGFGAIDPAGGTFTTSITEATLFVLTATSPAGTVQRQLAVNPSPPVINSFQGNSSTVIFGGTVDLSWDVSGASRVSIAPGGFSTTDLTGTQTFPVVGTTEFTLTAMNSVGTETATFTAVATPFQIVSFSADPSSTPDPFDPVTLSWEVEGVGSVSLDQLPGNQPLVGSVVVNPGSSTTYTLRVVQGIFTATQSVTVLVGTPGSGVVVPSFSSSSVPGEASIEPFVPFEVYILALSPAGGIKGFEFSVDYPACLTPLSRVLLFSSPVNIGSGDNYIVGVGGCAAEAAILPLVRITMFLLQGAECLVDQFVALGPATPSSFSPAAPGYLTCDDGLVPFSVGPPLPLDESGGGTVSVLSMELQAESTDRGIDLRWDVPTSAVEEVSIFRSSEFGEPVLLHQSAGVGTLASGSYLDTSAAPGQAYRYRAVAKAGEQEFVSSERAATWTASLIPNRSYLLNNVPNPFNPTTSIRFAMAESGSARVQIMDVAGRAVWSRTVTGVVGENAIEWHGVDNGGQSVASGVYIVQLETANGTDTRRIALLK